MTDTELQEKQIKYLIEDSVDESVERAFKKYGRRFGGNGFSLSNLVFVLMLLVALGFAVNWYQKTQAGNQIAPIEEHDLTLENDGVFGFTAADFQEAVVGKGARERLLVVEERDVYVNTTITESGFMNWGVFNKTQTLTIHGTGIYTVDLTQIHNSDITLDDNTYELTISIPHAQLHKVVFDPSKTEIGDTQSGWLAFGDIKLTAEQEKAFETTAVEKLREKLSEDDCLKEADRFAKLSAYEMYLPIIKNVSPAYGVVVEFP